MKKNNKKSRYSQTRGSRPITSTLFQSPSFLIAQGTSGQGGFTSSASAASLTTAQGFALDPFNVGGHLYHMAALFGEYRLRWIRLEYHPFSTYAGVMSTVSGLTSSPSYGSRNFAIGINDDPDLTPTSFNSITITGKSVQGNTSRRVSLTHSSGALKRWRFTSTISASPTFIDLRMCAPSHVSFAFQENSTTAAATYGSFVITGLADFRGIVDNSAPIGVSSSLPPLIKLKPVLDEQKENKNDKSDKGWFN